MITAETRRRGEKRDFVIGSDKDGGTGAQRKLIHEGLTEQVIGAAMEVHKALGPGLLESVYEECLCYELHLRGCTFNGKLQFLSFTKASPSIVDIALI
jgi:hypothetical protein